LVKLFVFVELDCNYNQSLEKFYNCGIIVGVWILKILILYGISEKWGWIELACGL
jgi:hypothetical protein